MLKNRNGLFILINYFIGYFYLIPYLVISLSELLNLKSSELMEFVLVTLHLLLTLYLARKLLRKDAKKKLSFHKVFIYAVGVYFLAQVINIVCNLIIIMVNGDLMLGENETAVNSLIMTSPFLAIYMAAFFAPISEELVFRGVLFKAFKHRYLAYFMGGVAFGLIHFMEIIVDGFSVLKLLHVFPYIFVGLLFCKVYQETDNIYYSILSHIIFNSISLCLTFLLI